MHCEVTATVKLTGNLLAQGYHFCAGLNSNTWNHQEGAHWYKASFWFSSSLIEAASLTAWSPAIQLLWLVSKTPGLSFLDVPCVGITGLHSYTWLLIWAPGNPDLGVCSVSIHWLSHLPGPRLSPFSRLNSILLCTSVEFTLFQSTIRQQTTGFYFCITFPLLW